MKHYRGSHRLSALRALLILLALLRCDVISQSTASQNSSDEKARADSIFSRIEHFLSAPSEDSLAIPEKCGLHYQFELRQLWNLYTPEKRAILKAFLARPNLQASLVSPGGRFRVHYDTTGTNTPALLDSLTRRIEGTARAYADSVAATFEYVWQFETRVLGYPPPPADKGVDGGNEYDIYILQLGGSFYGQTVFNDEDILNSQRPNPTYSSFIEVDNDYRSGYFSRGLKGLKVTAAHEFHHAIQLGNYGIWQDDRYYYEITSTWMEDVVYNDINDYYQYLPSYFDSTVVPFNVSNGLIEYGRALWGKFVEKRFGRDAMRRSWEYMNSIRSLPAIDASLQERGTSFVREFSEFSVWHFYTGTRADPVNYFTEGRAYPSARVLDEVSFIPPTALITNTARNLSIQFHRITLDRGVGKLDTISVALSNINVEAAERSDNRAYTYLYRFTTEPTNESFESLSNGIKFKLLVNDPSNWKSVAFLNSAVSGGVDISPYPNPFVLGKSGGVIFPIDVNQRVQVTLNIYSANIGLVYSKVQDSNTQFGQHVVSWDGKDRNGNLVSSGVYVYRIVSGDKEYQGKIAVVRQ